MIRRCWRKLVDRFQPELLPRTRIHGFHEAERDLLKALREAEMKTKENTEKVTKASMKQVQRVEDIKTVLGAVVRRLDPPPSPIYTAEEAIQILNRAGANHERRR